MKGLLGVLLFAATTLLTLAAEKELIYESGKFQKFYCTVCAWQKDSDLKPVTSVVERNGVKWTKFSFTGSHGTGRAILNFRNTISGLIPEGAVARGLNLTLDYPKNDFRKLSVSLVFKDGTVVVKPLSMEQGVKTYSFDRGWSRTKVPTNWNDLKTISLTMKAGFPEFYLKEISINMKAQKKTEIKIQRVRKVCEVLPGQDTAKLDFNPDSPLSVKLGYDRKNLYVNSQAKYSSKPHAAFMPGDKVGSVWSDELTEYFFSGWNDNKKFIQLATNLNGAVWNCIIDYDETAAMIVRSVNNYTFKHTKESNWKDGIWETKAVFPFESLKFDPSKQRFMGFQIAQQYAKDRNEKYKMIVWDECKIISFPDKFGLLVFNKKPFGPGSMETKRIFSTPDEDKVTFLLDMEVKDVKAGTYKLRKYVAVDNSFAELPAESLKLTGEESVLKIKYENVKNMNGVYSLYTALENVDGDLLLSAVNFDNSKPLVSMFGKPIFCPAPKKIVWGKGVFKAGRNNTLSVPKNASKRTIKTAKIFAGKLLGYAGKYKIKQGGNSGIILRIAPNVKFNGKDVKLKSEGYCLQVSSKKVVITGVDEAALYYGCRTFMEMLRQPMKRQDDAPVLCAEILDWPDLKVRFTNLLHPWHFHHGKFKEKRDINYLIDWVDRYVAGTRQNMFFLHVGPIVKYKRHPEFNGGNTLYSLKDMAKLAQFCRDNFIEFVPRWQHGGHAFWSMLQVHPELREKGYKHTADVTNPKHNKIMYDCMLDVMEATKCKYINVGGDEWWHVMSKKEQPDKLLNGKPRAQVFLDFYKDILAFAKKHGVEVMMHEDMLSPYHNGTRYDVYKVIDQFPKEIIILPWAGGNPDKTITYFSNKGFRLWANVTGIWFPQKSRKLISGYGVSVYSFFFSLTLTGQRVAHNYVINVLRGAEYAWNAYSDKCEKISETISSGLLPALVEQFAEPWNPAASQTVVPLDITKAFNTNFNKLLLKRKAKSVKLPKKQTNEGNIPTLFAGKKLDCIKIGKGDVVSLPVKAKFSSIIFLHTVSTDTKFLEANKKPLLWRSWIYGRPAGDYIVEYTDGSTAKIPLRVRDNINFAGGNPEFRPAINCRYIMSLVDATGNYVFLYQYEWVNPNPEKKIKALKLTQTVVNFDLLLFAVSGRKVK